MSPALQKKALSSSVRNIIHKIARVYGGTITELTKDSFTRLYDAVDELTKLTEDLFYSWHR
ncbi:hypothetical protein [Budvicia aquatica]|nr:hypothetical protein [Budvicia aquatica]